jgi:uncharacterized protein with FMN-binding domain
MSTDRERDVLWAKENIGMTNKQVGVHWQKVTGMPFDSQGCTEFYWLTSYWARNEGLVPKASYARAMAAGFANRKKLVTGDKPQLGAAVFFDYDGNGIEHTGRVVAITSAKITTVEGNVSVLGVSKARQRSYVRGQKTIAAYGYPDYTDKDTRIEDLQAAMKKDGIYTGTVDGDVGKLTLAAMRTISLKKGTNRQVNTLKYFQIELKIAGYYTGTLDGVFGNQMEKAVLKCQKENGLTQDGWIGYFFAKKYLNI